MFKTTIRWCLLYANHTLLIYTFFFLSSRDCTPRISLFPKKWKKGGRKVTTVIIMGNSVIGALLCLLLLPILVINCTLIVKSYVNKDAVPSFGSYLPLIVLTDFMYPEMDEPWTPCFGWCRATGSHPASCGLLLC